MKNTYTKCSGIEHCRTMSVDITRHYRGAIYLLSVSVRVAVRHLRHISLHTGTNTYTLYELQLFEHCRAVSLDITRHYIQISLRHCRHCQLFCRELKHTHILPGLSSVSDFLNTCMTLVLSALQSTSYFLQIHMNNTYTKFHVVSV